MRKVIAILFTFSFVFGGYGQADTVMVKAQKGFLFLSNYNFQYDYDGGEIRRLGFHDFFFPTESCDFKCLSDTGKGIVFKNGFRVDAIIDRKGLKLKAELFRCIDTTRCYEYDRFYIVPVILNYKLFRDYEPLICRRNYYELRVLDGASLRFEYKHEAITPTKIKVWQ